jgi:hypothetical protein
LITNYRRKGEKKSKNGEEIQFALEIERLSNLIFAGKQFFSKLMSVNKLKIHLSFIWLDVSVALLKQKREIHAEKI